MRLIYMGTNSYHIRAQGNFVGIVEVAHTGSDNTFIDNLCQVLSLVQVLRSGDHFTSAISDQANRALCDASASDIRAFGVRK